MLLKWLDRKIRRVFQDIRDEENCPVELDSSTLASPGHSRIRSEGMTFSVYRADGGFIVEYFEYEKKTGDRVATLHIVHEQDNLAEALDRIITLTALRR
jgi:hypothetical protein